MKIKDVIIRDKLSPIMMEVYGDKKGVCFFT